LERNKFGALFFVFCTAAGVRFLFVPGRYRTSEVSVVKLLAYPPRDETCL
jgi:hypothetical protein